MRKVNLLLCALLVHVAAFSQTRLITGKVTDKSGETLIGVSVNLKGTQRGASTDASGVFKLSVPAQENTTLVFTYIGYKTKEVQAGKQTQLNVVLEESTNSLEEVVVIGYGSVRKKDLTGAVGTVSADVIAAAPVSSALEAIQGRVAGINISTTEGSPDAEMSVRVRGGTSITSDNTPLFIVDNFPVNSIADIAPQDIESISILKDASSTAIYGARGANGVVLVTTKGGKGGKTSISYNAFTGTRKLADKLDVLSPLDYATWQYERALLDNDLDNYTRFFGNYQDIDMYANVRGNDWQELVFGRTGNTFNQNLNISGGGEKTKFSLSHSYVKDKAIMQLSGFQRHNVNFKLNHKLYDKLVLDFGARYADTRTEGGGANEQNEKSSADSRLKYAMIYPSIPVSGLTNSTETDPEFNLYNPLVAISDNDQFVQRKNYNLNGALTYEIIKDLKLRSEVGYDGFRNDHDRFYGMTTYYVQNTPAAANQDLPAIIFTNTNRNAFRNANTLNYDFRSLFNKDHRLNLMLGHEYLVRKETILTNVVHGFPSTFSFGDAQRLSTQGTANSIENFFQPDYKLLSFFGRANYDYKGKYLFTTTLRADGSSKFQGGNRWGYFPSASAAWRMSEEQFMEGTRSWLNDLKVRLSYGVVGNDNIPLGVSRPAMVNSTTTWVNGASSYWAASKTMPNENLKWETTTTRNLGVDFSALNGRLNGTLDLYLNNTTDLLLPVLVGGTGYDDQYRNVAETRNKGLEFSFSYNAIKQKNFALSVNANISFNRNKVLSLGDMVNLPAASGWASTEIGPDYRIEPGSPIGQIWGYQSDGRYEVSDFSGYDAATKQWTLLPGVADATAVVGTIRPGAMKLKDLNGDGKVLQSDLDKSVIGDVNPSHTGGFSINSNIFNFDLSAYFNWSYGNDIYNANKIEYTSTSKYHSRNMISLMETGQRWTNLRADGTISNDPAELEAMNANTTLWSPYMDRFILSDWAVEDGSFLRLGTLTLGYTLPKNITSKLKIGTVRFYASGYNLWWLTNYSGFDPEVSTRRKTQMTPGVDYSAYPKSRSYVFGVNVNF